MLVAAHAKAPVGSCPHECHWRGSCDYTTLRCHCRHPWHGLDCGLRSCPSACGGPSRGRCDQRAGVCICTPGYTGYACSLRVPYFCPDECAASQGGGFCAADGSCACVTR
jgi:hypothetical protein